MADCPNLYLHFPFCRRKCSYCALHSRAGTTEEVRAAYVANLVETIRQQEVLSRGGLKTIYCGGGSPGLCNLRPLLEALAPYRQEMTEFTVELHPLDVTRELLSTLRAGGVNRISMGVQSLDDAILADMGRGYTFAEAERAFGQIREQFDNAGIDLIVGYPGETSALVPRHARLAKWGLRHCSVYSLIVEEKTSLALRLAKGFYTRPSDDETLNRLAIVSRFLNDMGLERYEISNYAVKGFECRHNQAVWRGEDYLGLGEGAHGRLGLTRTHSGESEMVSPESDAKERRIFRLRTREGFDASGSPEWVESLDRFVDEGLLTRQKGVYRLTERGTEVCDTILAELV